MGEELSSLFVYLWFRLISCMPVVYEQVHPDGLVPAAGPGVGECLRDTSAPVRLAAERCAFHLFQLSKGLYCTHLLLIKFQNILLNYSFKNVQKPPWLSLTGDLHYHLPDQWIHPLIRHRIIQTAIILISSLFMAGAENVQSAQKYITGLDARRIAKQPEVRYTSVPARSLIAF